MELPWIEKYRPTTLSEVVGHEEITRRLKSYVDRKNVPNLMFSGPAGVGKTSAAVSLAKELYGKEFERNFLELNASDERGIDVVRNTIKDFARTLAFDANFKIIFLDESDALTTDAQQALRRTMERYTRTCRFILSCNYSSRLIEPIQSRCVVFRFTPLPATQVANKLKEIAEKEKVEIEEDAVKAMIYVSEGDLRKAINILQASASLEGKVKEETVYSVSSRAKPKEVREMIAFGLEGKFKEAREKLDTLMFQHGMSGEDVIGQLYKETMALPEEELPSKTKIELANIIGEYNFRLVEGGNERIQLEALLAQFGKFAKK
ncbi:MAG: replication factor C small subunit [Candidatus Diapherotrites archaeon]|nr:replication factor C small subunit [Candidatus Diapherotrites archaeon]